jgi:hypothetical protein
MVNRGGPADNTRIRQRAALVKRKGAAFSMSSKCVLCSAPATPKLSKSAGFGLCYSCRLFRWPEVQAIRMRLKRLRLEDLANPGAPVPGLPIGGTPAPIERPPKPEKPPADSSLDAWFEWRRAMQEAGYRCTLRDVAEQTAYSYGYVRQEHRRRRPNRN